MSETPARFDLGRRLAAEGLGTAFLLATVVGSGVMAERLAADNAALALLGNTLPTGAILVVLILMFMPVSGAHFNPAVTLAFLLRRELEPREGICYFAAQIAGGLAGVVLAHLMFELPALALSITPRGGPGQWLSELVATFGLVGAILGTLAVRPAAVAPAVGLYITAAYWFTASTSFANPAVTLARAFTDTFSGIAIVDVGAFVAAQLAGAAVAVTFFHWLWAGGVKKNPGRAGEARPGLRENAPGGELKRS